MLHSLLQKQLSYSPEPGPLHTFRDATWRPSSTPVLPDPIAPAVAPLNSLHLLTWNIDFMASRPRERMASALRYLEQLVADIPSSSAVVIFLQEIMESENVGEQDANDLSQIANAPWIQQKFNVTDIGSGEWDSPYGQVALVDRRLAVARVSRLRFVSEYQRVALFVDVCLCSSSSGDAKYLRLCNVHLDSSYGTMRPVQWKALAKHLQSGAEGVAASILAGDCNANQPRDRTEPQDNGFKDAYLELGRGEGDEEGATWGFQSLSWERWGRQRLDKEVFWGDVRVRKLDRMGVGVQVEDEAARSEIKSLGELPFVTDHYGLMGDFEVQDGLRTVTSD